MDSFKLSCHCGKVQHCFSAPVTTVVQCHCQNCRKLQSADFSSWVIVPSEQYSISIGKDVVSSYQATEKSSKNFCSICGSSIFLINGHHFPDDVVLPLGAIENYSKELVPQIQVYTSDKAPWVNIHQDVPIFS